MRLPRGISQTSQGWRISVRTSKGLFQKRFPPSTELSTLVDELDKAKTAQKAGRQDHAPGSFAADVTRYLRDYYTGKPGYDERQRHLALWTGALGGDQKRSAITRDDIARVLNQWRASGLAADTCNKRRTALLALYHALDGRGGSNPVREIHKFRGPEPTARGLPYTQIRKAFSKIRASKTKCRLMLMAYTGLRHGQIMKLKAEHWDKPRNVLHVPGTAKGRGTKPYTIPLSPPAIAALKTFDRWDAWGTFTTAPMARMWKAAITKAGLPEDTRPYDLRHSFGTAIYLATGDLSATKELLGHSSIHMTERYTRAAVPARQKTAIARTFAGRKSHRQPRRKLPTGRFARKSGKR